jgi:hypothetical protein
MEKSLRQRILSPGFLTGLSLFVGSAIVFSFRWSILSGVAYPPSQDAGGELFWMHYWLGQGPIHFYGQPQFPPLESLLIVFPFTHLFPVLTGIRVYMAFVPALIVTPAYLFLRESGLARSLCVLGGTLTASVASYSEMAIWNAGVNLFAIVFMLLALTFLSRALRSGRWLDSGAAGVCVGLVGATHQLTLTVTVIAFGLSFLLFGAFAQLPRRVRLTRVLGITGYSIVGLIPMFPLYRYLLSQQTNLGVGQYWATLQSTYLNFPFYAWSGEPITWNTVIVVSAVLTALGALSLSFAQAPRRDPTFLFVLAGVIGASLLTPPIEGSAAARSLYFLPIAFVPLTLFFLDYLGHAARQMAASSPDDLERRPARHPRWRQVASVLSVAVALAFVASSIQTSYVSTQTAVSFYSDLSGPGVAALNWIQSSTPSSSTFFDEANLGPWILGYSERAADSPEPLSIEATQRSLQIANQSDLIDQGNYLVEDQFVGVGNNFPDSIGSPTVFVYSPGSWGSLFQGQSGEVYVDTGHGNATYSLADASLGGVPQCSAASGGEACTYQLSWNGTGFVLTEVVDLSDEEAYLSWSSGAGYRVVVNETWQAPPSGYVVRYLSVGSSRGSTIYDEMETLSGKPFSLEIQSANQSQAVNGATGWVTLVTNGSSAVFDFAGVVNSHFAPVGLSTYSLVESLGIDYFVVNSTAHYVAFTRMTAGVYGPLLIGPLFECGNISVFQVDPPGPHPITVC